MGQAEKRQIIMSRRFRKPLEKKSVREDKRGPAKRGTDKRASGKGKPASGKPSFGPRTSEKRGPASAGKFASRPPARELHPEPVREEKPAPPPLPTKVQTVVVTADENNMRVDRFLEHRFPGLSFSHIQRIVRKGELRINGKRADSKDRLEEGQSVRIPPLKLDAPKGGGELSEAATRTLKPEFPAADIKTVSADLRAMSDQTIYLRAPKAAGQGGVELVASKANCQAEELPPIQPVGAKLDTKPAVPGVKP